MNKTDRDELIINLRKQDKTFVQIAEEIGCGLGTVRKVIRAYPGDDIRKEQFTTAMNFEQAKAKYCPDGFDMLEYHSGQTGGYVRLKCKTCGHEFTKLRTSFCGENGKNKTHCPECDRLEQEAKHKQQEKLKRERERERALAITGKQLSFNICPVCSEVFEGTGKFCGERCRKKAGRKNYKHQRRVRVRSQIVDKNILIEPLAMREHNRCYLCGKLVDWNDKYMVGNTTVVGSTYPSIEHIIPISKGGLEAWTNVKLAHMKCNREKGSKII
jgi:5-methylcytosine-specific restriction endonuclease McrA